MTTPRTPLRLSLILGASTLVLTAAGGRPAHAEAEGAAVAATAALAEVEQIIVTSRNRAENLQNVPIPVTAVSGKDLERANAVNIKDFSLRVPNVLVNAPNARQTSIAVRGLGKNTAIDALEPSVGVIVDNVVAGHVGTSWINYIDIDHIELLRGPQGTLLGKNTTLGVLNVVTKTPSFDEAGEFEITRANRDGIFAKAAVTGPIVADTLAYRATFYYDHKDGSLKNIYRPEETYLGSGKWGARVQLLGKTDAITARFIVDHYESDERINVNPSLVDPLTFTNGAARTSNFTQRFDRPYFGGYKPIIGSYDTLDLNSAQPLKTEQNGASADIAFQLPKGFTLTSITAYRELKFDARNDTDLTRFDIQNYNGTLLDTRQYSQELRLASPSGARIDYQVGLFYFHSEIDTTSRQLYGADAGAFYATGAQYSALTATAAGLQALKDSLGGVFVGTSEHPETTSYAAYGQANWHVTDKATLTLGLRDTQERKASSTDKVIVGGANLAGLYSGPVLTNALAVRNGRTIGAYGPLPGKGIDDNSVSWLISPSYKLSPDVLLYASAARGEKSGAVQFDANTGAPNNVRPEKVIDFELGVKSRLLDGSLILNVNLYRTKVDDYQATLSVQDGAVLRTYLGNVGKVQMQGLEYEGVWRPLDNLHVTFSGAFNDATYKSFTNAPAPVELQNISIVNLTGQQLSGAPRYSANFGIDYDHPITDDFSGYVNASYSYRSKANLNSSLSQYGVQDAYGLVNAVLGLRTASGRFDLSLWGKNLGDETYNTNVGSSSGTSAYTFTPGERRTFGVTLRAKL